MRLPKQMMGKNILRDKKKKKTNNLALKRQKGEKVVRNTNRKWSVSIKRTRRKSIIETKGNS